MALNIPARVKDAADMVAVMDQAAKDLRDTASAIESLRKQVSVREGLMANGVPSAKATYHAENFDHALRAFDTALNTAASYAGDVAGAADAVIHAAKSGRTGAAA